MDQQSAGALCLVLVVILSPVILFLSKSYVREDIRRVRKKRR